MNNTKHYSLSECAKAVGVPAYRIQYAIGSGYFPETEHRIGNRRAFSQAEVEKLREYFRNYRRRNAKEVAK